MEVVAKGILWLHIACGFAAFFCAPVALATRKGGTVHRRFGRYYFWLMAGMAATGTLLALRAVSFFLVIIAVFSFYFAFRGYRALLTKAGPRVIDRVAAVVVLGASAALLALGIVQPAGWPAPGASISVIFGLLGIFTGGSDLYSFARPPADPHAWWYAHMNGMLGSYIAAISAFSAINLTFIPMPWRWLWPTIAGTPLVILWIGYYRKRFQAGKQAASV